MPPPSTTTRSPVVARALQADPNLLRARYSLAVSRIGDRDWSEVRELLEPVVIRRHRYAAGARHADDHDHEKYPKSCFHFSSPLG